MIDVVGVGHEGLGDDAVGLAVAARVRALAPAGARVRSLSAPIELTSILVPGSHAVVIDALVGGGAPGSIHVLSPADLDSSSELAFVSTHGFGVHEAIRLARALAGEAEFAVTIVGIAVGDAPGARSDLSPCVAAAVQRAARMVVAIAGQLAAGVENHA
jgi:hydrogenase maturation protease